MLSYIFFPNKTIYKISQALKAKGRKERNVKQVLKQEMKDYTTPSISAELIGVRLIHILAFPLHKHAESLWNKWEVESAAGEMLSLCPLACSSVGVSFIPVVAETLGAGVRELSIRLGVLCALWDRGWAFHRPNLLPICSKNSPCVYGQGTLVCGLDSIIQLKLMV